MLAVADRQLGFFDAAWCSELLPEGSIYALLAEHGERIVRDEDFADCYSERHGRPSIPPRLLAKVLLLAYRDGLSDERAMEAVRFDLREKIALDRRSTTRACDELGSLPRPAVAAWQGASTPVLGAAAVQDTAVLVRAAVRKLVDAVSSTDKRAAGELRRGLASITPNRAPSRKVTGRTRTRAWSCLPRWRWTLSVRCVRSRPARSCWRRIAEAVGLLREIVGQEFEVKDDEVPRVRRGRGVRQIASAHDPEMRHGRKTPAKQFTGYKVHAAADAEAPILTAISLSPGNEHDGRHAGS